MRDQEIGVDPAEFTLRTEYEKAAFPLLVYLGTPIIWLSFLKDVAVVGFQWNWLLIRLCYLPFILLVFSITKRINRKNQKFYELPLWAATLYITAFCTYFASRTGFLASKTTMGLVLLYFGAAILPVSSVTFVITITLSALSFVAGNVFLGGWQILADGVAVSNFIPLVIFSYIVFFIIHNIRKGKLATQRQLAHTLLNQRSVIEKQSRKLAEVEIQVSIGNIASQVAHDIRSPLAALDMVLKTTDELSEDRRVLIRSSISRIKDIANSLLQRFKDKPQEMLASNNAPSPHLLSDLIESLLTEKRLENRSRIAISIEAHFSSDAYGIFAAVNAAEFKNVISNLINNAVDAVDGRGNVIVRLEHTEKRALIKVEDDGKGIPAEILPQIGQKGFSYGKIESKESGSGLGLYQAKEVVGSWGGSIEIESRPASGTRVSVSIPRCTSPNWFADVVKLGPSRRVVILDDDMSIHGIWSRRLKNIAGVSLVHLSNPEEFGWDLIAPGTAYLFDYEFLGQRKTGLDLVEKFGLSHAATLVTSHFEEDALRQRCASLAVKMIPKSLADSVPIRDYCG